MKMLKWALLGGAAVAVTTSGAQADDLSALKAQLEALQARVTQLEAQPSTSLPSGYSLMSFRSGGGTYALPAQDRDTQMLEAGDKNGFTISVLPTADVAPAAEVTVSGEIRTYIRYNDHDWDEPGTEDDHSYDSFDVVARARLVATGKADTAVGEVGGRIRVQEESGGGGDEEDGGSSDDSNRAIINQAYGWWKFSPNWQLIAGLWDSTAAIQAGVDWDFTGPINTTWGDEGSTEQMRLVFNNGGPLTIAIAVEDSEGATYSGGGDVGDLPAFAGYVAYDNEGIFLQVAGIWQDDDVGDNDDWYIGGGARFGIGEVVTLTAGTIFGEGYQDALYTTIGRDDEYWTASAGVIFNIGENSRAEIGADYLEVDDDTADGNLVIDTSWGIVGGLYWDPVSQVTVGINADYRDQEFHDAGGPDDDHNHETFNVRFVTYLRF